MRPSLGLDGPSPAWPRPLDAALDAWAASSGRTRAAARVVAAVLVVLTASGGLLRGPHGAPVEVLVTRTALSAGSPVSATVLTTARWPTDLVPPGALTPRSPPLDAAVTSGLVPAGSVVTEAHLVRGGPGAFADGTTAVVPVPADALPVLAIGTRLDLAASAADGGAAVVARGATVVADDGAWRWIRVQRDAVADVAAAISRGSLVVAVLPPARPDGAP